MSVATFPPSTVHAATRYLPAPPSIPDPGAGSPPVEFRVSEEGEGREYPRNSAYEPTVAAHPTEPQTLAVVYQGSAPRMRCGLGSVLRISRDGGATWSTAKRMPMTGRNRGENYHATIAWGPSPVAGGARLYWVNTTVPGCDYSQHSITISWSDDYGQTWSVPFVNRSTAPWIGGLPSIAVDRNPESPGYGSVYVVYNHLASLSTGSGVRVLASVDYGRTWSMGAEIPPAAGARACRDTWRISLKSAVAPDGRLYVVGHQTDMRHWDPAQPFARGGSRNVCRQAFTISSVAVDRSASTLVVGTTSVAAEVSRSPQSLSGRFYPGTEAMIVDPTWAYGLSIDAETGEIFLAVGDVRPVGKGAVEAVVRLGRSADGGVRWSWQEMPAVEVAGARSEGRGASGSFRPVVAACGSGRVVVGVRTITATAGERAAASAPRTPVVVGGLAFVSTDGGATWSRPLVTARAMWDARILGRSKNGVGLSDSATCLSDGHVVFAYGDGREGAAAGPDWGRTSVYLAVVDAHYRRPQPKVVAY